MTWKAMAPTEVCDVLNFWAGQRWPLARDEVHRLAVARLGWTTEVEDGKEYLLNPHAALSIPNVSTIGADRLSYLRFRVTDSIRDRSADSAAFLGDAFTLIVREGTSRWGRPRMTRKGAAQHATWEVEVSVAEDATDSGAATAHLGLSQGPASASAEFVTPTTVARDRLLGNR